MENPTPGEETDDFRSRDELVRIRTSWWFAWCSGDLASEKGRRCQIIKIISASFLPGLLLLAQNSASLSRDQKVISLKEDMYKKALYGFEMAQLVHLLQIERGLSAMFVGSGKDASLILRLQDAYDETNDAIWALSKWIPPTSEAKHESRESYQKWIQDFRYEVFTSHISSEEVVTFYTSENALFIDWILTSLRMNNGLDNWSKLVPYHFLTISKESAGIERAIGSALYTKDNSQMELLLWYVEAHIRGNAFLDNCVFYSSFMRNLLKMNFYESHGPLTGSASGLKRLKRSVTAYIIFHQIVGALDRTLYPWKQGSELETHLGLMRRGLLYNETFSHSVYTSKLWFDNMTTYINILQDFHEQLGTKITKQTEAEIQVVRARQNVSIIMIVLAAAILLFILVTVNLFSKRLQSFLAQLEKTTAEYVRERRKNEHLMVQILPVGVAKRLVSSSHVEPEVFKSATVFFSDIYHFTELTAELHPVDLIKVLNAVYRVIDDGIEARAAYKAETIGDVYMVASGIPERNGHRHTVDIAELSLDLIKTMETFHVPQLNKETFLLRIGFCTGPVSCGVAGSKTPRYCLFGDTVNLASRMKATSQPMKIQITEDTYKILNEIGGYVFKRRGYVPVKDKGDVLTYWLLGRKGDLHLEGTESPPGLSYTAITNVDLMDDGR